MERINSSSQWRVEKKESLSLASSTSSTSFPFFSIRTTSVTSCLFSLHLFSYLAQSLFLLFQLTRLPFSSSLLSVSAKQFLPLQMYLVCSPPVQQNHVSVPLIFFCQFLYNAPSLLISPLFSLAVSCFLITSTSLLERIRGRLGEEQKKILTNLLYQYSLVVLLLHPPDSLAQTAAHTSFSA